MSLGYQRFSGTAPTTTVERSRRSGGRIMAREVRAAPYRKFLGNMALAI
jgi:hypothetical protein